MPVPDRRIAVYLEPAVIRRLDALARAEGVSRSALLRRAAVAVLDADDRADAALQASYGAVPQDQALVEAAARLASRTVPEP